MLKEIKVRRCIRKYKPDKVSKEAIIEIIKAAQFAPNGNHTCAWEFLVVEDQNLKEKLFDIVGQDFVKKAPILIVPAIDSSKAPTPVQDLAVASENIFLQATNLGLGTVWKNVRTENEVKVKEILNIPQNYLVINLIPVGYADEKVSPHGDSDFNENKIHWGKW